jgi:hypothetical protein
VLLLAYFSSNSGGGDDNNTDVGGIINLLFGLMAITNEALGLGIWYLHHDKPQTYLQLLHEK